MFNNFTTKRPSISLIIPLFLTVILRIIYWAQVHNYAWFIAPGTDPLHYSDWAKSIIAGNQSNYFPFFRGPLYPYLLSLIYAISNSWLLPRIVNLLADLTTIVLIYQLARQWSNEKSASYAAYLFAFCGIAIYFTGELLATSIEVTLFIAFIYAFTKYCDTKTAKSIILSGLFLGLLSLSRPNAIVLLPLAILILLLNSNALNLKKRLLNTLAFLLLTTLIIAPATIINYKSTQKFVPIATSGGVNLFIGNHHTANGWASILPEIGSIWTENQSNAVASNSVGKILNPAEESQWYVNETLKELATYPITLFKLQIKKVFLLFHHSEIGNNRPLSLASDASLLIRLLFSVSIGFMFPLALIGIISVWKNPIAKTTLLFTLFYALTVVMFFVSSRYRMPLVALTALFAGIGLNALLNIHQLPNKTKFQFIAFLILGITFTYPNWTKSDFENRALAHYIHGNALQRIQNYKTALNEYKSALALNPQLPFANLNMGVSLLSIGDTLAAETYFQREMQIQPLSTSPLHNLGIVYEFKRDWIKAQENYLRAYRLEPLNRELQENLVRIHLKWGDELILHNRFDDAMAVYSNGEKLFDNNARLLIRIAGLHARNENIDLAIEYAERALFHDPAYSAARELLTALVRVKSETQ